MIRRKQTETIICDRCGSVIDNDKYHCKDSSYTAFWNKWKPIESAGKVTEFVKNSMIDGEISNIAKIEESEMYGIQIEFMNCVTTRTESYDLCPDCVKAFKKFMKGNHDV